MSYIPGRGVSRRLLWVSSVPHPRNLSESALHRYHRFHPQTRGLVAHQTPKWAPVPSIGFGNRRNLFGSAQGIKTQDTVPDAIEYLSEAARKLDLRIRPPPPDELADNLDVFFSGMKRKGRRFTDYHLKSLTPLVQCLLAGRTKKFVSKLPEWLSSLGVDAHEVVTRFSAQTEKLGNATHDSELTTLISIMAGHLRQEANDGPTQEKLLNNLVPMEQQRLEKVQQPDISDGQIQELADQLSEMRSLLFQGDMVSAVLRWEAMDTTGLGLLAKDSKYLLKFDHEPAQTVRGFIRASLESLEVDDGLLETLTTWHNLHGNLYDPETLASLVCHYASIEDIKLAVSTMRANVSFYTMEERIATMKHIQNFAIRKLEDEDDSESAWHAYKIICARLPEVERGTLEHIMTAFIVAGHPKEGMEIFQFMRNSHIHHRRPDEHIYTGLFQTFTKHFPGDKDAVERIYNQLKIDTFVNPSTTVWSAAVAAFLEAGLIDRALMVWESFDFIGLTPSAKIYEMALLLHGVTSTSPKSIDELWKRIESEGIDDDNPGLLCAYIGALASKGDLQRATTIIKDLDFPEALSNIYYASMASSGIQQLIEAEFPGEMTDVLKDKATEELYDRLLRARLRGQGVDIDDIDDNNGQSTEKKH